MKRKKYEKFPDLKESHNFEVIEENGMYRFKCLNKCCSVKSDLWKNKLYAYEQGRQHNDFLNWLTGKRNNYNGGQREWGDNVGYEYDKIISEI